MQTAPVIVHRPKVAQIVASVQLWAQLLLQTPPAPAHWPPRWQPYTPACCPDSCLQYPFASAHCAVEPLAVQMAPVLPVEQVPLIVQVASAVQVEPMLPAVHLLTAPQVGFTPFAVQAVPVFGTRRACAVDGAGGVAVVHVVVLGMPAVHLLTAPHAAIHAVGGTGHAGVGAGRARAVDVARSGCRTRSRVGLAGRALVDGAASSVDAVGGAGSSRVGTRRAGSRPCCSRRQPHSWSYWAVRHCIC